MVRTSLRPTVGPCPATADLPRRGSPPSSAVEALSAIGSWATVLVIWGYAAYEYDAIGRRRRRWSACRSRSPRVLLGPLAGTVVDRIGAEGHAGRGQGPRRRRRRCLLLGAARLPGARPAVVPPRHRVGLLDAGPAVAAAADRRRAVPGPHQRARVADRRAGHRVRPGGRRRSPSPRSGSGARSSSTPLTYAIGLVALPLVRLSPVPLAPTGEAGAEGPHARRVRGAAPDPPQPTLLRRLVHLHLPRPHALRRGAAVRAALRARRPGALAERLRRAADGVRHLPRGRRDPRPPGSATGWPRSASW